MYQVILTGEQVVTLQMYIRMTTNYRTGEQQASKILANEQNEDGSLRYPNLTSNAQWWEDTEKELQEVLVALDVAKTQ